ncbi:MAG: CPBP family intramembrane glutamic endopeptidase [Pseudomonadota bacterium]
MTHSRHSEQERQEIDSTEQDASKVQSFWLPLVILVSLTVVTQLFSVSFTSDKSFADIFLPSAIALLLISTPLAALGLFLGSKIGLGAPLLTSLLMRRPGVFRQLARAMVQAAGIGLSLGFFLWLLRLATVEFLPPELPELGHRGAVGGLLVSISAAVGEEVWLRLGVMTILAWVLVRVLGQHELTPRITWTAIVVSALAFAAIHLPQLAAAGAATSIGIAATMLGNTLVGIAFGWFYWKHGIIAAITAHFATDVVLHVIPALLS